MVHANNPAANAFHIDPAATEALLGGYRDRWEIGLDRDTGAWEAEQRPTPTTLHLIVAHDPAELAAKLAAAEAEGTGDN